MPTIINEQKMIEENVFLYEQKLKSPLRRFTDKSFVPVKYWHIKSNETTVDGGYGDIAQLLGPDSPLKFQRIDNLPLYGLDQLLPQLQSDDAGLDTSIEGDATIMAGTIEPFQNDFFMITHLNDSYVFRVTSVEYDILTSDNCFKISFQLEYIDNQKVEQLNQQTKKEFTCVLENIGTDERCIIENSDKEKLDAIDKMYNDMVNTYLTFYYNERYNCLLGDLPGGAKLYDPYQTSFINSHGLFKYKNQLDSVILTEQIDDPRARIKYEKSIYRCVELQRLDHLSTFPYVTFLGKTNRQTAFYRWLDESVYIVDIPRSFSPLQKTQILPEDFVSEIELNGPDPDGESTCRKLLKAFIRKEELTIYDIPLTLSDELMVLEDANLEIFFITPLILYIIRTILNDHLTKKKNGDDF